MRLLKRIARAVVGMVALRYDEEATLRGYSADQQAEARRRVRNMAQTSPMTPLGPTHDRRLVVDEKEDTDAQV